jgi:hypothetical protein
MKSREELKRIAQGILAGTIFSSWSIDPGQPFPAERYKETDTPPDKLTEMVEQWEEDRGRRYADAIKMIFLPIAFADKEALDHLQGEGVEVFYEEMGKALPRSINGYPIFMSVRTLTAAEANEVQSLIEKIENAMEEI